MSTPINVAPPLPSRDGVLTTSQESQALNFFRSKGIQHPNDVEILLTYLAQDPGPFVTTDDAAAAAQDDHLERLWALRGPPDRDLRQQYLDHLKWQLKKWLCDGTSSCRAECLDAEVQRILQWCLDHRHAGGCQSLLEVTRADLDEARRVWKRCCIAQNDATPALHPSAVGHDSDGSAGVAEMLHEISPEAGNSDPAPQMLSPSSASFLPAASVQEPSRMPSTETNPDHDEGETTAEVAQSLEYELSRAADQRNSISDSLTSAQSGRHEQIDDDEKHTQGDKFDRTISEQVRYSISITTIDFPRRYTTHPLVIQQGPYQEAYDDNGNPIPEFTKDLQSLYKNLMEQGCYRLLVAWIHPAALFLAWYGSLFALFVFGVVEGTSLWSLHGHPLHTWAATCAGIPFLSMAYSTDLLWSCLYQNTREVHGASSKAGDLRALEGNPSINDSDTPSRRKGRELWAWGCLRSWVTYVLLTALFAPCARYLHWAVVDTWASTQRCSVTTVLQFSICILPPPLAQVLASLAGICFTWVYLHVVGKYVSDERNIRLWLGWAMTGICFLLLASAAFDLDQSKAATMSVSHVPLHHDPPPCSVMYLDFGLGPDDTNEGAIEDDNDILARILHLPNPERSNPFSASLPLPVRALNTFHLAATVNDTRPLSPPMAAIFQRASTTAAATRNSSNAEAGVSVEEAHAAALLWTRTYIDPLEEMAVDTALKTVGGIFPIECLVVAVKALAVARRATLLNAHGESSMVGMG